MTWVIDLRPRGRPPPPASTFRPAAGRIDRCPAGRGCSRWQRRQSAPLSRVQSVDEPPSPCTNHTGVAPAGPGWRRTNTPASVDQFGPAIAVAARRASGSRRVRRRRARPSTRRRVRPGPAGRRRARREWRSPVHGACRSGHWTRQFVPMSEFHPHSSCPGGPGARPGRAGSSAAIRVRSGGRMSQILRCETALIRQAADVLDDASTTFGCRRAGEQLPAAARRQPRAFRCGAGGRRRRIRRVQQAAEAARLLADLASDTAGRLRAAAAAFEAAESSAIGAAAMSRSRGGRPRRAGRGDHRRPRWPWGCRIRWRSPMSCWRRRRSAARVVRGGRPHPGLAVAGRRTARRRPAAAGRRLVESRRRGSHRPAAGRRSGQPPVVEHEVDAADQAVATLRQSRVLADAALADAEAALLGLGWPPGEDLLAWATRHDQLVPVTAVMTGLATRLDDLRARDTQALQTLAAALRADPRDPVQALPPIGPPAARRQADRTGRRIGSRRRPVRRRPARPGRRHRPGQPRPAGRRSAVHRPRDAGDGLGVRAALDKARDAGGSRSYWCTSLPARGSQGRAAISVGDITTADNVATLAPGVRNAPVSMADGICDAARCGPRRSARHRATRRPSWPGTATTFRCPRSAGVPVGPLGTAGQRRGRIGRRQRPGRRRSCWPRTSNGSTSWRRRTARFVAVGLLDGLDDGVRRGRPRCGDRRYGDAGFARRQRGRRTRATTTRICRPSTPSSLSFDQDPVTRGGNGRAWPGWWAASAGCRPSQLLSGLIRRSRTSAPRSIDVRATSPTSPCRPRPGRPVPGLFGIALANEVADLAAPPSGGELLLRSLPGGRSPRSLVGHYSDVPIKPGR